MDWRRIAEAVVVAALLVAAFSVFGDPRAEVATLASVDLPAFALALATTLGGVVAWSGTMAVLLRVQGYRTRLGWFQTVFVAGVGLRSIVPGGSASGPAVLAYLVSRTTAVPGETSVAMAYVTEVFLWVGSATVGTVGILGLLLFQHPSARVVGLAAGLTVVTLLVFAVVLYGIRNPDPVEARVYALVSRAHAIADGRSAPLADVLDPDAVEASLDRFFDAFRRLADDPRHVSPALAAAVVGWFVHATTLYFVFLAVGVHAPYAAALFIVPVGGLAEGLSVLPGGIGSVEPGLLGLLFLLTPVDFATATTVVVLYRLSNYWFRVALGFLALPVLGVGDVLHTSSSERARRLT